MSNPDKARWVDLFGIDPDYCEGQPVDEWLDEQRGEADAPQKPAPVHGMCLHCHSVEVELNNPTGARDLTDIGESSGYPTGYGCEVCS